MTHPSEPLKVDPVRLQIAADQIDGQASEFRILREATHNRAASVGLGSGSAAAALPGMLAAWEADGVRFDQHFDRHARGHREAAPAYSHVDADEANGIDDAGAGF